MVLHGRLVFLLKKIEAIGPMHLERSEMRFRKKNSVSLFFFWWWFLGQKGEVWSLNLFQQE